MTSKEQGPKPIELFEVHSVKGVRGLALGTARCKVRPYFGEGWIGIPDTPNGVPADLWSELGFTAFDRKDDALLYLAFEKDKSTLRGNRRNAMPFSAACAAIRGLATDVAESGDLISSASTRIVVIRGEGLVDRTAVTCVFESDFLDVWMKSTDY